MALNYKVAPISKDQIKELRKNPLWAEMVSKYGEENVINNYIVDYVVLQEEKAIYDASGQKLDITADLIRKVYAANQSNYEKFIKAPINKIKSWVNDNPELTGYAPVITDHDPVMANKHGLILAGSFKLLSLPNESGKEVLHLLCKAILLSPEAKWGYVTGNWRQVSPTILQSYKISELSYVPYSAQMNNSSLSSGEQKIKEKITMTQSYNFDSIFDNIELSVQKAQDEIRNNEIKLKESLASGYSNQLVQLGIITSGQKQKVNNAFMQLGNGEQRLFFDTMKQFNKHRVSKGNGSKTFFLQGAIETMNETQLMEQFKAEHKDQFKTALEMTQAFNDWKIKRQQSMSLANGEGKAIDKSVKYDELLKLLEEDEEIDEKIKDRVVKLCSSKFGAKLADGANSIDAGGVSQPNNTTSSLGGGEQDLQFEEQKNQITNLSNGLTELKNIVTSLVEENNALKAQLSSLEPPITDNQPEEPAPSAENNQDGNTSQGGE